MQGPGDITWPREFPYYWFVSEVCIITDHKPLVSTLSKDVVMLSQQLQHIMLGIHQYRLHIIYKPGPNLSIVDWLSQNNHTENRDQEITGMNVNVSVIHTSVNKPVCISKSYRQ